MKHPVSVRQTTLGSWLFQAPWLNHQEHDSALYQVDDMCAWCLQQFGKENRRWNRLDSFTVAIFNDRDAMLFKLSWI